MNKFKIKLIYKELSQITRTEVNKIVDKNYETNLFYSLKDCNYVIMTIKKDNILCYSNNLSNIIETFNDYNIHIKSKCQLFKIIEDEIITENDGWNMVIKQ